MKNVASNLLPDYHRDNGMNVNVENSHLILNEICIKHWISEAINIAHSIIIRKKNNWRTFIPEIIGQPH